MVCLRFSFCSSLSCDRETFDKAKPHYEEALKRSGYKPNLQYIPDPEVEESNATQKKKRKRQIIWFNPPYDKGVRTDVARRFLQLVDKHFSKDKELKKLFNRSKIKVSYSCMQNMENIIKSYNQRISHLLPQHLTKRATAATQAPTPKTAP